MRPPFCADTVGRGFSVSADLLFMFLRFCVGVCRLRIEKVLFDSGRRLPNLDTCFSFHILLLVVAAPVIVMDGDGSSNAVAGPSTLPDAIFSYLPPAGKSSHYA